MAHVALRQGHNAVPMGLLEFVREEHSYDHSLVIDFARCIIMSLCKFTHDYDRGHLSNESNTQPHNNL
jgi:hypothetical protein